MARLMYLASCSPDTDSICFRTASSSIPSFTVSAEDRCAYILTSVIAMINNLLFNEIARKPIGISDHRLSWRGILYRGKRYDSK